MPNPISTSFLTSATPVSTGAHKADETLSNATDGQFSGLLNQALLQNQTGNTPKTNHIPASHKTESQPKSDEDAQLPLAENTLPDESHTTPDPTSKKTDATPDTTEQNTQADLQNLQAIALSLQIQPNNLNTLQGVPLLIQQLSFTAPATHADQPVETQQAVTSISANNPNQLTQTLNPMPATTPLSQPVSQQVVQNQLAFSLPPTLSSLSHTGNTDTQQAPLPVAQNALSVANQLTTATPTTFRENTTQGGISIPASGNDSRVISNQPIPQLSSSPIISTFQPAQTNLNGPANAPTTTNSMIQSDLSQSAPLPSQIQSSLPPSVPFFSQMLPNNANSGNPASDSPNAIAAGLEPQPSLSQANPANAKPNASAPGSVSFLKSLNSLHTMLQGLNGEVETATTSASSKNTGGKNSDSVDENPTTDSTASATSDLLAMTGLGGAPTNINNTENTNSNVPAFSSTANNPVSQVAEGTAYSVKNGHKELIIRLNPDNLGEVRINLTSHANQELSARLIASTPESHNLLKTQLDSLKNTLESQGITVDRLSVVLAGSPEASTNSNAHQQQHSQQQASQQPQQPTMQQGSFQQQFNQQNPGSTALFNQMGSQAQNNFAQRVNSSGASPDTSDLVENVSTTTTATGNNDNGRISILA